MRKNRLIKTTTILLLCLTLIFSFSFSFTIMAATTTKDVTSQVVMLGNPFNKATFAKNVWDMQVYNGRIYLGHGDYNSNAGPIPVIYYDPVVNKFVTQYSVNEEQIDKYKVLNGKLYIPGTDSKESWDYGNFYVMDNDQWNKFRTIPNAVHVFDMAYYNGQLYAATGTAKKGWGEVLTSKDLGETWTTRVPQTNNTFTPLYDWAVTLFESNNKLYAAGDLMFPKIPTTIHKRFMNLLAMDGNNSAVQPYTSTFFPGAQIYYNYDMLRPTNVNNNLVYLGVRVTGINDLWSPEAMYVASSINQARRIVFPEISATPTDIVVRGNTTYVLTYIKNSTMSYSNIVYKTDDLQNWTELFRFNTDTFARSFEELNGDFYFGLGCNLTVKPTSTGNILKVAKAAYKSVDATQTTLPIITDNTDSCFTSNSTWTVSSATSGFYGANYLQDGNPEADLSKWAKWTPNLTESGNYNIYMRWTSGQDRPVAAPLEIKYSGGTDTTKITNQQKDNGTWVLIGTYNMLVGTDNYVKTLCSSPGNTIADSVKFEKVVP